MATFKIQPVPSELNLTINHLLLARQAGTHIKTISGDTGARAFFEAERSYKVMANKFNKMKGDLTRSDTEKAYIISTGANKWMKEAEGPVNRAFVDLSGRIVAAEEKLAGLTKETTTTEAIVGAERRTFLRSADIGKRASLAENDPQFAAAIAAAPAAMSGVEEFTHERCVMLTQQRKDPTLYGELQDYRQVHTLLNNAAGSMVANVHAMSAEGIVATRVEAEDPAGMGAPVS